MAVQGVYCEPVSVQSLFSGKIQRKSVESTGKVRLPCRNLPELLSFFPLSEHPRKPNRELSGNPSSRGAPIEEFLVNRFAPPITVGFALKPRRQSRGILPPPRLGIPQENLETRAKVRLRRPEPRVAAEDYRRLPGDDSFVGRFRPRNVRASPLSSIQHLSVPSSSPPPRRDRVRRIP